MRVRAPLRGTQFPERAAGRGPARLAAPQAGQPGPGPAGGIASAAGSGGGCGGARTPGVDGRFRARRPAQGAHPLSAPGCRGPHRHRHHQGRGPRRGGPPAGAPGGPGDDPGRARRRRAHHPQPHRSGGAGLADVGGQTVDRDRAPAHRRNGRARTHHPASGRRPHPGAASRHRRSGAGEAPARQDRQDDLPSGGREGVPYRCPGRAGAAGFQTPALGRRVPVRRPPPHVPDPQTGHGQRRHPDRLPVVL